MQCPDCSIEMINEDYFKVCPDCGRCDYSEISFVLPDMDTLKFWHPMIYSRSDYFIKILFENRFDLDEIKVYMNMFNSYIEAFDNLKPRKNLLSRRFVLNEFNRILHKPIPYERPIKTSKSLKRVKMIWKQIVKNRLFGPCPLK